MDTIQLRYQITRNFFTHMYTIVDRTGQAAVRTVDAHDGNALEGLINFVEQNKDAIDNLEKVKNWLEFHSASLNYNRNHTIAFLQEAQTAIASAPSSTGRPVISSFQPASVKVGPTHQDRMDAIMSHPSFESLLMTGIPVAGKILKTQKAFGIATIATI